jgi:hypothetical protein
MHHSPVEIATEIFVPLDRVGADGLDRALSAVWGSGCRVEGYAEIDGALHVLTDDLSVSCAALSEAGFAPREAEVIVLDVAGRPGIAQRVYRRIADAHVHEKFSYVATGNRLVIGVNETFYAAAC